MEQFVKQKTVKPQDIEVGKSIQIHAGSFATFKTYVSRYNKDHKDDKIKFEYSDFIGAFCKATRLDNVTIV